MVFLDQLEAGRRLADRIARKPLIDPVVVIFQPGSARVAWEIAKRLRAPIDVVVAFEVDLPRGRSIPIGAAAGGTFFPDQPAISIERLPEDYVARLAEHDLRRQSAVEAALRRREPPLNLAGRSVILVDDGWGRPHAVQAAVEVLRTRGAAEIIYAGPCCAPETSRRIGAGVSCETLVPPGVEPSIVVGHRVSGASAVDEAPDLIGRSRRFHPEVQAPFRMNRSPGSSAAFQASMVSGPHFGSQSCTVDRKLATKGS